MELQNQTNEKPVLTERPRILSGMTYHIKTGCGKLYITINQKPDSIEPYEVFITAGKAGSCFNSTTEMLGRLISSMLKNNIDIKVIIKQLSGINCNNVVYDKITRNDAADKLLSCGDGISLILRRYAKEVLGLYSENKETEQSHTC